MSVVLLELLVACESRNYFPWQSVLISTSFERSEAENLEAKAESPLPLTDNLGVPRTTIILIVSWPQEIDKVTFLRDTSWKIREEINQ